MTLDRPGASPMRQSVRAPADGSHGRPVVTFRVPLEEAGTAALSLAVGPLDGDARPDNDRRTVMIQVADDKANVLLVDGEARWEFRYLRNALARDPHVKVKAVVFHQPGADGSFKPTYETRIPRPTRSGGPAARPARRLRRRDRRRRRPGRPHAGDLGPARILRRRARRDAGPEPRPEVLGRAR